MKIYNPSLLSTDITGSIRLTNEATASLIGQLSSSLDDRYILSGSVSNADWDTLLNKPENIFSGSFNDIPENPFTSASNSVSLNGDLLPSETELFDLGSTEKVWKELFVSTGSIKFVNNGVVQTTINSSDNGGIQIGNVLITTASIVFVDNEGVITQTVAESSSVGITSEYTTTSSFNEYTSSNDGRISKLETESGSIRSVLNSYTSSNDGRLNNIETFSGSINSKFETLSTYTSSNDTTNTTQNGRLTSLESATQSLDQRLDSFENVSSSYARTDVNNNFTGLQTFNNISVNGTASFAYIQSTTGSSTSIGEAFIILNENTPSSNFAGIKVVDSGSTFATASFVYDGLNNNWVFQHTGSPSSGSSLAIFGPLSQGGLGTETKLTENRVPKAVTTHGHHIGDSNITDDGLTITLGSNTVVNGTIVSTGTTIISSSAQITLVGDISGTANATSITSNCIVNDDINTSAGIVYTKLNLNGSGLVSGSSQVSYTGLSNIPAGIVSGSTQIVPLLPTGTVSGSSQVALNSTTGTLCVNKGGTGDTTYTNGQLLIGNTTGNTLTKATLTGTTNQITVTNGAGSITLSTPQNTHTAACVQFGSFGVGTAASGVTGEIRATNEVTAFFSDDRLKTRLGKIEDALNKVKQLNGYYFVENDVAKSLGYTNDNRQVGVSAQEVQSVLPEVVTTAPISDEYLTVRYDKMIPLLIEAVKEQNNIVEALINEVEKLKNTLNNRG
jgi:hypothetical protein